MMRDSDIRRLLSRGYVWDAGRPSAWPPAELLDDSRYHFYIGRTIGEAIGAKRDQDISRIVTELSIGGSERTGEGCYFYGPAPFSGDGDPYGELHGSYAILASVAATPGREG